ncbi:MAG: peptidoglycan bridge formation glycyltransferase FemA/FemB family protein [Clostridia bacterium]|nr:peptidoglycan bridge formation glycyltransferase FemA/FemB family protein [Clostridia bacterium]MDD4571057.1 peptidoglycan bridge formation glycyltransferase FemA/FemB family protein [Clostridia bacterium]
MTLSARVLNIEDKAKFNRFMETHPKGHVLQSWEWGEVKAVTGWKPIRVMVEDEKGSPVAAVSLLKRRLPAGMGAIFYSPRGPVIDAENLAAWDVLTQKVKELAHTNKVVFWKSDPDVDIDTELGTTWQKTLQAYGFKAVDKGEGFEGVQPRYVFRLDIHNDLETLLAACHQKTRYNIRLAAKKGVKIVRNPGREALPIFYKILVETATRDRFLIRPYSYFEGFYDNLKPAGQAELFMAYLDDEPISGTLAFKMGNKAWYIYGASSNKHRNYMPNYLIQWSMIEWAKENNCTMYDFRGVPGDVGKDHPLYGLVKFKRGFGGKYTCFIGEYDLVYRPFMNKIYSIAEPAYQKLVRVLIRYKKKLKGK